MKNVYFLYSNDITNKQMNKKLYEIIASYNDILYLTSSKSVKDERIQTLPFLDLKQMHTIKAFKYFIKSLVAKNNNFVSKMDQRFILYNLIKESNLSYIHNELFKLFDFMIFNDINQIEPSIINKIKIDFSKFESDIFTIYNDFIHILSNKYNKYELYQNKMKKKINNYILNRDCIVLDNFLWLNDISRFIVNKAISLNKDVYFICNCTLDNKSSSFIIDMYKENINHFEDNVEFINLSNDFKSEFISNLDYVKKNFEDGNIISDKCINLDGSIEVYNQFMNRSDEFKFISSKIVDYLSNNYNDCEDDLNKILNNDVAIVIPSLFGKESSNLVSKLDNIKLFVKSYSAPKIFDRKTCKDIYISKQDFINEDVRYIDGVKVTLDDKKYFFDTYFKSFYFDFGKRNIMSYPIIQCIRELYVILKNGSITINSFKKILYSNLFYFLFKEDKSIDLIGSFKCIEVYLDDNVPISNWIDKIEHLIHLKQSIMESELYKFHPLYNIKTKNLSNFYQYLKNLEQVINLLNMKGSFIEHINALKRVVFRCKEYMYDADIAKEIDILLRYFSVVTNVIKNTIINKVNAHYFALTMISIIDNMDDFSSDDYISNSLINIVNICNIRKYKCSILVMCEDGNIPSRFEYKMPFTKNIIDILSFHKYKICKKPISIYNKDYHFKLQKYLFNNVLNFTTQKLIFTYVKNDKNENNNYSIYLEDICSILNRNVNDFSKHTMEFKKSSIMNAWVQPLTFDIKEQYSLLELFSFKLCPKLFKVYSNNYDIPYLSKFQLRYYLVSIVFCAVLNQFARFNSSNKKVYSLLNDEFIVLLDKIIQFEFNNAIKYFDIFNEYELKDIINECYEKISKFIKLHILPQSNCGYFNITNSKCKIYKRQEYDLIVNYDLYINDESKRRLYQSNFYIDFLVSHTSKFGDTCPEHYKDIINYLDNLKSPNQDRINLINRLITKVNIQFDNNKFINDGLKRVDELFKEIKEANILNLKIHTSKYCNYCRLRDICKENNLRER